MLGLMIRSKPGVWHSAAVLSILLAALPSSARLQTETGPDAARVRQLQNQQALELRQEQQRYLSLHRPVTPPEYFRLEDRLLAERLRQQSLNARLLAPRGRPTTALRPTDLIRYRRQQAAQRLGFRLNRRP